MPFPGGLVVKNGSKIFGRISSLIPSPRIVDRHQDTAPFGRLGMNPDMAFIDQDFRRLDGEFAAARHRVARIRREIHQHLMDLA